MEPDYDSDSVASLENIADYEDRDIGPSEEEENHIEAVRNAVSIWKERELDKASDSKQDPQSLDRLKQFLVLAARLLYDLLNYIQSAKNKDENMKDKLYVKIITSIGNPDNLTTHERINIENILNRDLVELPFTVNPKMINAHAKKGIQIPHSFSSDQIENGQQNSEE